MNPSPPTTETVTHQRFSVSTVENHPLACDARFPTDHSGALPVVLFLHGFKGFKDWGSIPYICTRLAESGFYTLSFNFSHNGVEGDSTETTRPDLFEKNTITREVNETVTMVDAVVRGAIPNPELVDRNDINIVGHSRGGGVALLAASRDNRIRRVATWAAVSTFHRYTDGQRSRWREQGFLEVVNSRTGQVMRLGTGLLDDIENNADELDVCRAAARLSRPLLILHGEADLSVRIDDAEAIARSGDPALTTFVPIPRTNHTFGAVHPFEGPTPVLDEAILRTTAFLHDTTAGTPGSNRNAQ